MKTGNLISIYITPAAGQPMQAVEMVHAVPGRGLEGDRHFLQSDQSHPDRQVTLIEIEALEALEQEHGIALQPDEARRNLLTHGVSLNNLVNRIFQVGEVKLRGLRLCEPCDYLAKRTQPGVLKGLVHRAGLRAEILSDGMLRIGDVISIPEG